MNIFNILTSPISKFFYLFLFQLSNCKFFYWQMSTYLLTCKDIPKTEFDLKSKKVATLFLSNPMYFELITAFVTLYQLMPVSFCANNQKRQDRVINVINVLGEVSMCIVNIIIMYIYFDLMCYTISYRVIILRPGEDKVRL